MKISALILTNNEEEMIDDCLAQLDFVDEIIILDQNSQDKTLEISKQYTTHVLKTQEEAFDKNRNTLSKMAKGDWLLYIDADERLTQSLISEIRAAVKQDRYSAYLGPHPARRGRTAECSAFYFPRKNIIFGKWLRHGGWWPDYVPRLIRRSQLIGWEGKIHESPKFHGQFANFKSPLIHLTGRNLSQMLKKSIKWAKIEAELYDNANFPKVSILKVTKALFSEFFRRYLIKRGFLDSQVGLIESIYQAFHQAIVLVYLWELQNNAQKKIK